MEDSGEAGTVYNSPSVQTLVPFLPALGCPLHRRSDGGGGGGRLREFAKAWKAFCPDKWIVGVVTKGYHLEFTEPPPAHGGGKAMPTPSDPGQKKVLEEELQALLRKGAATRTTGQQGPRFLSSFFLAPKKRGAW